MYWQYCSSADELKELSRSGSDFRYIFFLHWSSKVETSLLESTECVCFHMTDVPYGRGGSPLQNLIQRGHRETQLSALRMTSEFDAGPVYMKKPLSLEGSTAEEIYLRASRLSCEMALEIADKTPTPIEQQGEAVVFRRRTPKQSEISGDQPALTDLFDHIRMLDATGYPKAFIDIGKFRIEFSRAALYHGEIKADVRITEMAESSEDSRCHKKS
jgi:methionyl-tRNA formyltransferase